MLIGARWGPYVSALATVTVTVITQVGNRMWDWMSVHVYILLWFELAVYYAVLLAQVTEHTGVKLILFKVFLGTVWAIHATKLMLTLAIVGDAAEQSPSVSTKVKVALASFLHSVTVLPPTVWTKIFPEQCSLRFATGVDVMFMIEGVRDPRHTPARRTPHSTGTHHPHTHTHTQHTHTAAHGTLCAKLCVRGVARTRHAHGAHARHRCRRRMHALVYKQHARVPATDTAATPCAALHHATPRHGRRSRWCSTTRLWWTSSGASRTRTSPKSLSRSGAT